MATGGVSRVRIWTAQGQVRPGGPGGTPICGLSDLRGCHAELPCRLRGVQHGLDVRAGRALQTPGHRDGDRPPEPSRNARPNPARHLGGQDCHDLRDDARRSRGLIRSDRPRLSADRGATPRQRPRQSRGLRGPGGSTRVLQGGRDRAAWCRPCR